jgi:hypothetical protein
LKRQVVDRGIDCLKRREINREVCNDQLEEVNRALYVFEMMLSHIPQAHILRQVVFNEFLGHPGEKHLPAISGSHEPRCKVNIQAEVAVGGTLGFARVQAHADTHLSSFWPGISGQAALGGYCCRDGICGTSEGDEERISPRVNFVAVPLLESGAQKILASCEYESVAVT